MENAQEIINRGFESKDLDYKGPIGWDSRNDKAGCCALVKDILAMANTKGGYLVLGVKEKDEGFEPVGLSEEQIASFETTKLNQFLQNYADPPINTHLYKEDNKYVIIKVPVFSETPHMCEIEPSPHQLDTYEKNGY